MGVADGLSRVPTRLTTIPVVGVHCSDIVCQTFDETDLQSINPNVVGSTRVPPYEPEHSACSHNSSGMMFAFCMH